MTKEEAILKAHEMYAYEISEQTDVDNPDIDHVWQSLYDICQLATYGIIEDLDEEEIVELKQWLKDAQPLTKDYQNTEIYF